MPVGERIKFFFVWTGQHRVKIGARIREHTYAEEFPNTTALGTALDIVRSKIVRKATGLEYDNGDNPDPPTDTELF